MGDYHWPDAGAVELLNAMLDLPVTGREQDWEIELADEARVPEWLALFRGGNLGVELRAALALLIMHSIFDPTCPELTSRTFSQQMRSALEADPEVRERMMSYWSRADWLSHSPEIRSMLRGLGG